MITRLKLESRESSSNEVPPDPLPSTSHGDCIICEQKAHGIHFGVSSCRACAAFFRRTVVLKKEYPCRRFSKKCIISKEIRYLCRYCRFQKCIDAGMTPDNVVYPKDAEYHGGEEKVRVKRVSIKTETTSPKPVEIQESMNPPSTCPSMNSAQTKISVECKSLAQTLIEIFKTFHPLEGRSDLTGIHQLAMATYSLKTPEPNLEILELLDINVVGSYWTRVLVEVAQWMQYIKDFALLDFHDKIIILRNCWCSVHRLLNVVESLDAFGEDVFTEQVMIIGKKAVSAKKSQFPKDLPSWQTMQSNFVKSTVTVIEVIARPMFDMCATHMELAFLLGMTLWDLKGLPVSESTLRIADHFQTRLADEMHEYYINTCRVPCYAPRLIQLMEILKDNENLQKERAERLALLQLFDILSLEIGDESLIDPLRV